MNIRLIALDLDGTLLTSSKTMTDYTKKILLEASERGIQVALATGRTLNGVQSILAELPFIRYVILANGAVVMDTKNGEVIRKVSLPRGRMAEYIEIAKEKGFFCDCFIDGKGFSGSGFLEFMKNVPMSEYMKQVILATRSETADFEKIVRQNDGRIEKANMLFHTEKLRLEMKEHLEKDTEIMGVTSLGANIEITHKNATKGRGILALADYVNVPIDTVMTFGDSENDFSMIQAAGWGIAMGNADDFVKAGARCVTKTNDEDGVAYMVERIWK